MAGLKWVNKYKKQKCKVYKGEELVKVAAAMGFTVDLEKIQADEEAKKAKKLKEKEDAAAKEKNSK